ncbi:hypothetical protein HDU76_008577, partial [Blyttiomyces sp. JEL0837]
MATSSRLSLSSSYSFSGTNVSTNPLGDENFENELSSKFTDELWHLICREDDIKAMVDEIDKKVSLTDQDLTVRDSLKTELDHIEKHRNALSAQLRILCARAKKTTRGWNSAVVTYRLVGVQLLEMTDQDSKNDHSSSTGSEQEKTRNLVNDNPALTAEIVTGNDGGCETIDGNPVGRHDGNLNGGSDADCQVKKMGTAIDKQAREAENGTRQRK